MDPFSIRAWTTAITICTVVALHAVKKKSLSPSGAVVGWICGICIISTGYRGLVLFYFYQIGSWCTKYNIHIKSNRDGTLVQNSNRGISQVLCVSIIATLLSLYHAIRFGMERPMIHNLYPQATSITLAIIAHHATGLADTMASELGILVKNPSSTFLITTGRSVPPGTNGGITIMGCFWSCIGGTIIGVLTILTDYFLSKQLSLTVQQYALPVIVYSTIIGFLGSLIDSVLGATCQATFYDPIQKKVYHANSSNKPPSCQHITGNDLLSNEQVNLLSTAITCIIGGWFIGPIIVP